MDAQDFAVWLDRYREAWERRDADAAAALFAEGATYHEMPFDEPIRGREAIHAYWSGATGRQEQVRFTYAILAMAPDIGVNHWSCTFIRAATGALVRLDGIFAVRLDEGGLCTEFREWWHHQEVQQAGH